MTTNSPNKFCNALIDKHGDENGRIAYFLFQEQSRLINDWRTFLFLFCGDKRRIDVMSEASHAFFFDVLQGALWDATILRLRRLSEPNVTGSGGRNQNIGLQRILELVPETQKMELSVLVEVAIASCATVKTDVDKALAHNDLTTFMSGDRFQTVRGDVTQAVKNVKLVISYFFHNGDMALAEQMFPVTSVHDEQAMLTKLFVGNLKMEEILYEEFRLDVKNGPRAEPVKIIPDWIWDHSLRDRPF